MDKEISSKIIENVYERKYKEFYHTINSSKLGLFLSSNDKLISDAFKLLQNFGFDFTTFFRGLSKVNDIINKELKISKFENFSEIKNIFGKEKLNNLMNELINELIEESLKFEEKISNQCLKINPIALNNLEELMKGK